MQTLLRLIAPSGAEITPSDLSDPLLRAVIISLFTWRRADPEDVLPSTDRMGWWGDTHPSVEGDRIGSRLWLLSREKLTAAVEVQARDYAIEALQWLLDDGVAESVTVETERQGLNRLAMRVLIVRGDQRRLDIRFIDVWSFDQYQVPTYIHPPFDPLFNSVAVLLRMDNSGLTDEKGHVVTKAGSVGYSTSPSRWSGSAAFGPSTAGTLTILNSGFVSGANDFCVETWLYLTSVSPSHVESFFELGSSNPVFIALEVTQGAKVGMYVSFDQSYTISSSQVLLNSWNFVSLARSSGFIALGLNGVTQFSKSIGTWNISANQRIVIGNSPNVGYRFYSGNIGETRLTNASRDVTAVPQVSFPSIGPL